MRDYPDEFHVDFVNGSLGHLLISDKDLFKPYDAVVVSRDLGMALNPHQVKAELEKLNCKLILDVDDYWNLNRDHILFLDYVIHNNSHRLLESIRVADFVIASTPILAKTISRVRYDVDKTVSHAFNAVDDTDDQFKYFDKSPSKRVRIGWVGGLCHRCDIETLRGPMNVVHSDAELSAMIQIQLCGFSANQSQRPVTPNKDGGFDLHDIVALPMHEQEFYHFETVLSGNRVGLSDKVCEMLASLESKPNKDSVVYNTLESMWDDLPYRRVWMSKALEYAKMYDNIDISIAPLYDNEFNRHKSELKIIEAGFKKTPIIVSRTGPYKDFVLRHGGEDRSGVMAIEPSRERKDWYRFIKKLASSADLREEYSSRLMELCRQNYSITRVNEQRRQQILSIL